MASRTSDRLAQMSQEVQQHGPCSWEMGTGDNTQDKTAVDMSMFNVCTLWVLHLRITEGNRPHVLPPRHKPQLKLNADLPRPGSIG